MSEYNIARDVLEFRLTGYRYGPDSFPMAAVEIYINGENFRGRIVKLSATPLRNRPHMVFCSQGTS